MIPPEIIDKISRKISRSVDRMLGDIRQGMIETEPNMTDRLLGNIQRDFEFDEEGGHQSGINLKARTLRDRGRNAAETRYGADIATLLDVDLPNYKIRKGFLAQSKWIENPIFNIVTYNINTWFEDDHLKSRILPDSVYLEKKGAIILNMSNQEFQRMIEQCEKMLAITPDSFIFLYTEFDVYVISANDVLGSGDSKNAFGCKNLKVFMEDYLNCFIGDRKITGVMNDDFDRLKEEYDARTVLFLGVSQ